VLTLPVRAMLGGAVVLAVGILYRAIRVKIKPKSQGR
jgi:hypothetical protein